MGSFDSRSVEGVAGKDDAAVGRHPARIGPRGAWRGEAPLLHVRLDDGRVAEPWTGEVDQQGRQVGGVALPVRLAPRRRRVQRDRGGGADALGDVVGDEGDVVVRRLDTSGRLDQRRSVERGQQGDRAVVVGAHQIDRRVRSLRRRAERSAWGSGVVTTTRSATRTDPSSMTTCHCEAVGRTAKAIVEHDTSRPTARSFASEFIPAGAT